MARRRMAWGPSNPLWRWQHGKAKTTRKRRSRTMARRRRGYSRKGSKKLFGLGTKGLIGGLGLLGVLGGAMFGETIGGYIPVVNQQSNLIKGAVGGFIVGGPAGAVGNVVKQYAMGSTSTGSAGWP